jgi:GH24 family phage-related lysozyme (muramidase)
MTPELQKAVLANLEAHEGRKAWLYPDSKGNPTVGVGHLVATPQAALSLPFVLSESAVAATPAQIVYTWNYVKSRQLPYTQIILLEPAIDALALADLKGFEPIVQRTFPEQGLPLPVLVGLWDMVFNLGTFREFPNFVAAVHARDWPLAADECRRRDVGAGRNRDTGAQFLAGVTARPMEQAV